MYPPKELYYTNLTNKKLPLGVLCNCRLLWILRNTDISVAAKATTRSEPGLDLLFACRRSGRKFPVASDLLVFIFFFLVVLSHCVV